MTCICGETWCQAWDTCRNVTNVRVAHGLPGTAQAIQAVADVEEREREREMGGWQTVAGVTQRFTTYCDDLLAETTRLRIRTSSPLTRAEVIRQDWGFWFLYGDEEHA